MERYVKKLFWLVPVVSVVLCAFFSARATLYIVEAKVFSEEQKPDTSAPHKRLGQEIKRDKNGAPIISRNMFCAECIEVEPEVEVDDGSVPYTDLPLELLATNLSQRTDYSFATILNTKTKAQGAYWLGGDIPGAGTVEEITGRFVDFYNEKEKRRERVELFAEAGKPDKSRKSSPPARPVKQKRVTRSSLLKEAMGSVKKVGDNSWEIDRAVVDKAWKNPMAFRRQARVTKAIRDGKSNGVRLYSIKPKSLFAKLGLSNGDTLHSINGMELTMQPDKALELMVKLKEASNIEIETTRRGKPVTLQYTVR